MCEELKTIVIDEIEYNDKERLLGFLAEQLDFPEYFGMNYDAFSDCLGDVFTPLKLVFVSHGDAISAEPVRIVHEIASQIAEDKSSMSVEVYPAGTLQAIDTCNGDDMGECYE